MRLKSFSLQHNVLLKLDHQQQTLSRHAEAINRLTDMTIEVASEMANVQEEERIQQAALLLTTATMEIRSHMEKAREALDMAMGQRISAALVEQGQFKIIMTDDDGGPGSKSHQSGTAGNG